MPIGIHCRPWTSEDLRPGCESLDEVFGVVAAPETGLVVSVYEQVPRGEMDALTLGRMIAQKLLAAGAGPLLAAAAGGLS